MEVTLLQQCAFSLCVHSISLQLFRSSVVSFSEIQFSLLRFVMLFDPVLLT